MYVGFFGVGPFGMRFRPLNYRNDWPRYRFINGENVGLVDHRLDQSKQ